MFLKRVLYTYVLVFGATCLPLWLWLTLFCSAAILEAWNDELIWVVK
jgi:hypothetical protein